MPGTVSPVPGARRFTLGPKLALLATSRKSAWFAEETERTRWFDAW
jgi:hypothetical protein